MKGEGGGEGSVDGWNEREAEGREGGCKEAAYEETERQQGNPLGKKKENKGRQQKEN